ncbi:MAG: hypothetical protein KC550_02095 [Nanoarchaeota archaeon]|nr:hypothetical protein [Nanoarchaeota archaeon]
MIEDFFRPDLRAMDFYKINSDKVGLYGILFPNGDSRTKIDLSTARALELELFGESILPKPITHVGNVVLKSSILAPKRNVDVIRAKQNAIRILENNQELRDKIDNLLRCVQINEVSATSYWNNSIWGSERDKSILSLRELVSDTIDLTKKIPKSDSKYINQLLEKIISVESSGIDKLSRTNVCRQGMKIISEKDVEFFSEFPLMRNTLSDYRLLPAVIFGSTIGLMIGGFTYIETVNSSLSIGTSLAFTGIFSLLSSRFFAALEKNKVLPYLFKKYEKDVGIQDMFHSVGSLDELLTLTKFGIQLEENGIPRCMPEIVDDRKHYIELRDLTNLITSLDTSYIRSKEFMLNHNIHFLTGPNSGGKTTNAKASQHIQILAQMGSYVPASYAKVVPASRLFYQVGENDKQSGSEGGYGAGLQRNKNVLTLADSLSYAIVDDLIDGTDPEQTLRDAMRQFYGLAHTGANVVFLTHKHQLVDQFKNQTGKGNYLMVEFDGDTPTRQIIYGISHDSKGDLVSRRVGMDQLGMETLLRERGCLALGQSLYDL